MDNIIVLTKTLLLDICRNYFLNILPNLNRNENQYESFYFAQQNARNKIEHEWEIVRNWSNETIMEEMSIILLKNPNLFCEWFDLVSYMDYITGYPRKKTDMTWTDRRVFEEGAPAKKQKTN